MVANSESLTERNLVWKLREERHQDFVKKHVIGANITRKILELNSFAVNSPLVTEKALLSSAEDAIQNIKKENAFTFRYIINENGMPKKSGESIEDSYVKLLDYMYVEVKEGRANKDNLTRKLPDEQPNDWIFPRWFGCLLFGCFSNLSDRLDLFINQDKEDKSKFNRKTLQAEAKKNIMLNGIIHGHSCYLKIQFY